MKSILFSVGLTLSLFTSAMYAADTYKFDPVPTQVTFFVNHLGFTNSSGRFHVSENALQFDEKDWTRASVQATIQGNSLDMGDTSWKVHLSGARLLDAEGSVPTAT